MDILGRILIALIAAASIAGPVFGDEISASADHIVTDDNPTLPYVDRQTPVFTTRVSGDIISWSMVVRQDRTGGASEGTITVDVKSKLPFARTLVAATLKNGAKLDIDRVKTVSESCQPSDDCQVTQHLVAGITGEQLLSAKGGPLVVTVASEAPFEIEFPAWVTRTLAQAIAP